MQTDTAMKNKTPQYSCFLGLYWMSCCTIFGYTTVFLLDRGYTGGQIGVIMAMGNVFSALLQPVVSSFVEKSKKISLVNFCTLIGFGIISLGLVLAFMPTQFYITAGLYMMLSVANSCMMPLTNAIAFVFEKMNITADYAIARGIGSLTFAIMSMTLGILVKRYGASCIPLMTAVMMSFVILCLRFFPNVPLGTMNQEQIKEQTQNSAAGFFKRYPSLLVVILGCVLINIGVNMTSSYLILIIQKVGGDSATFGMMQSMGAFLELPSMLIYTKLVHRYGRSNIFKFAAVFIAIKIAMLAFATTGTMVFAAQLTQIFGWGFYIPSTVEYIKMHMNEQDQVKGQGIFSSFTIAGGVISGLLGGFLIDGFGVVVMSVISLVFSAVGACLVFFTARDRQKNQEQPLSLQVE